MRLLLAASAALVLTGASASTLAAAQTSTQTPAARPATSAAPRAATAVTAAAPSVPLGPPRAFPGYTQPDVGGPFCRNISPAQTTCTIPSMTAGRYKVRASATGTSQGKDAVQALSIQVGSRSCGRIDNKKPWPTGARTVRLDCEIVVVTDRPLQITASYADTQATKDPRGPTMTLERLPWDGVLSTQVSAPPQQ